MIIVVVGVVRLVRRRVSTGRHRRRVLDFVSQALLIVFGFCVPLLVARSRAGLARLAPEVGDIAFALPLAMLAYTGLETVANYAEEVRGPGKTCRAASSPRSGRRRASTC